MSRKKNPVWAFFDIEIGAPQFAICKVCRAKISRGNPAKPADFSPTAMVKHMGQHPAEQKIVADKVSSFFPGQFFQFLPKVNSDKICSVFIPQLLLSLSKLFTL